MLAMRERGVPRDDRKERKGDAYVGVKLPVVIP